MATGVAGPIDPSDLSDRLSSLPLEDGEGESASLFGASEGELTSTYVHHVHVQYMCVIYIPESVATKQVHIYQTVHVYV